MACFRFCLGRFHPQLYCCRVVISITPSQNSLFRIFRSVLLFSFQCPRRFSNCCFVLISDSFYILSFLLCFVKNFFNFFSKFFLRSFPNREILPVSALSFLLLKFLPELLFCSSATACLGYQILKYLSRTFFTFF